MLVNYRCHLLYVLRRSLHKYCDRLQLVVLVFFNPSRPASKITAIAKYGFADGSTERTSIRVETPRDAGIRINGERFCADQAT